jgi:TolA-binding protein
MKKALFFLTLAGILSICLPQAALSADSSATSVNVIQQTVTSRHKIHKKRKRVKHSVTGKSARAQMQLKQGQKHIAEEHKMQKAQQQLKKDTSKSN